MTKKNIRVDFYKVIISGGLLDLRDLLKHVDQSPVNEERSFWINKKSVVRLKEVSYDADFCFGDMVRIKMDDLPTKSSINSNHDELIQLNTDEGIGTGTAFLYHSPSRILLMQSVSSGVNSSNFSKYFMRQYDLGKVSVVLHPILYPC
jgi:hypothetical protein